MLFQFTLSLYLSLSLASPALFYYAQALLFFFVLYFAFWPCAYVIIYNIYNDNNNILSGSWQQIGNGTIWHKHIQEHTLTYRPSNNFWNKQKNIRIFGYSAYRSMEFSAILHYYCFIYTICLYYGHSHEYAWSCPSMF